MNSGLIQTDTHFLGALATGGSLVLFTEDAQRQLHVITMRKAAQVAGIEALLARAVDSGEYEENVEMARETASEMREQLQQLAAIIGQMTPAKAA